jgi:hypothetical protein
MHWMLSVLGSLALVGPLVGCNGDENAVKEAMAKGTSCAPDKVQVKNVSSSYGTRIQIGYAVYQVNVCGGGWRVVCLQRGVGVVTPGEETCLQ